MMKFCYVDIDRNTDVDAALRRLPRRPWRALQRDFPDVTFVYVTVPLTTDPGCCRR